VRKKSHLDEENKKERLEFALQMRRSDYWTWNPEERATKTKEMSFEACLDEMNLVFHSGLGKVFFFPDDLEQLPTEKKPYVEEALKQGGPSLFLSAAVTCPTILNAKECGEMGNGVNAEFCDTRRGIIFIDRLKGDSVYERGNKKFNTKAGDAKHEEITMDGQVYSYTWGVKALPFFEKYFDSDKANDDGIRWCDNGVPFSLTKQGKLKESKKASRAAPATSTSSSAGAVASGSSSTPSIPKRSGRELGSPDEHFGQGSEEASGKFDSSIFPPLHEHESISEYCVLQQDGAGKGIKVRLVSFITD
jgi:hypothetical protein